MWFVLAHYSIVRIHHNVFIHSVAERLSHFQAWAIMNEAAINILVYIVWWTTPFISVRYCYGLNICVPPNSCVEDLTPNVMVLGGGAFGRQVGLDEVIRVEPPRWD